MRIVLHAVLFASCRCLLPVATMRQKANISLNSPSELKERWREKAGLEFAIYSLKSEAAISHTKQAADVIKHMLVLSARHLIEVLQHRRDVESALNRLLRERKTKRESATPDELLSHLSSQVAEVMKPYVDIGLHSNHTKRLCMYASRDRRNALHVAVEHYSKKLQSTLGIGSNEADAAGQVALTALMCQRRWRTLLDAREIALGKMTVYAGNLVSAYSKRDTLDTSAWLQASTMKADAAAADLRTNGIGHITHQEMPKIDHELKAARKEHNQFAERVTVQLQKLHSLEIVVQALRDVDKKRQQQEDAESDIIFQRAQERERQKQGRLQQS